MIEYAIRGVQKITCIKTLMYKTIVIFRSEYVI